MDIQLNFTNSIDSSLDVGDLAYACNLTADGVCTGNPLLIGTITSFGSTYIIVNVTTNTIVDPGMFILFSKPIQVEESGLKGYYANVTFENNSKTPVELFAISSEASISSK